MTYRSPALAMTAFAAVLLGACAPAQAPAPSAQPSAPTTAPAPATAIPASVVSSPSAVAAAATSPAGDWNQILAAARQEGSVAVLGPAAQQTHDALTTKFEAEYPGISVQYDSAAGSTLAPKIIAEHTAGQNTEDLFIGGTSTTLAGLKPDGAITPVLPYLTGPSSQDQAKWLNGKLTFADDAAQYSLVFSAYVKSPFFVNPQMVQADEIKSFQDLLDPKWKGKIAMLDPRIAGGGHSVADYMYYTPGLGKDFMQQFFQQDIVISTDDRQILNWVSQGQYPIGIGAGDAQTIDLMRRGLPIQEVDPSTLSNPPYVTDGSGTLSVITSPPHPNALQVYLDYLLSEEGQAAWSAAVGFASLRQDVPTTNVEPFLIPKPGVDYWQESAEPVVSHDAEVNAFLKSIIPS